jgi:hypothetical protein
MTRDEIIAMFTEVIDRCWESGFDEGYRRGQEDQGARAKWADEEWWEDQDA